MASDLTDASPSSRPVLRVAMLSPYFEEHRGGVEIVAGALARALGAQDMEIVWLATGAGLTDAGPKRIALSASNIAERLLGVPYPLLSPGALRKLFAEIAAADVVLLHDSLYATSIAGFVAARRYRKPVLVVQHVGLVPYRNPLLKWLMKTANRIVGAAILMRADQVVFISELTRRYFETLRYRRAPEIVFNGVDTQIFHPPADASEIESARRDFALPLGARIALFVGRFVEKKGLFFLERLARERPDVLFVLAGWGAIEPAHWGLANVRVFDNLSGASLAPLYRAADVLLLPSTGEGFPLVVQEALACGLPVVCGLDTAGADRAAEPWLTAIAIDANDQTRTVSALVAALARVLETTDRPELRAERFEFARARYSWRVAAERYASMLRGLVTNARSVHADL